MNILHCEVALAGVAAAALAGCSSSSPEEVGPRYNVLLVTLDTTRPDRMSCYGHGRPTTPRIDAIAEQGALFERAISTAGITPMSHSSILTGLNNYEHGMRVFYSEDVSHRLKEAVDTLPEILKPRGWNTAATVSAYPVSDFYNLDQGFDHFDAGVDIGDLDLTGQQRHATTWFDGEKSDTQRRGDYTVNEALGWLDEKGADGPWCLWVHMFDVHDFSIVPPLEFSRANGFGLDAYPTEVESRGPLGNQWRERMYDPELAFMDAQVGRIVDWLEENDQWDRTIVVITADHGQGLTDGMRRHQWMKHRLLYDWCIRVPLIVRIPGEEPRVVVGAQVRTIDVLPTILEALEVPWRQPIEGESVLSLIRGETEPAPRLAYADALNVYDAHSPKKKLPAHQYDNLYCVTDGTWKLIWHEMEPEHSQLFHLGDDPEELVNLYAEGHAEAIRLKSFLDDRRAMLVEPPGAEDMTEAERRKHSETLKALGYGGGDDEDEDEDDG